MSTSKPFLFDRDFKAKAQQRFTDADLAAAEERGFARGLEVGQNQARNTIDARLLESVERLANGIGILLSEADARQAESERSAVDIALSFGRKLAGAAIARAPIAPIAEAAEACFAHLDHVPHLAARVNEALVDETQAVLERLAHERGFAGRIIVLGDPDIFPGDARLEWAEGGIMRDAADIDAAVSAAVAAWAADPSTIRGRQE